MICERVVAIAEYRKKQPSAFFIEQTCVYGKGDLGIHLNMKGKSV